MISKLIVSVMLTDWILELSSFWCTKMKNNQIQHKKFSLNNCSNSDDWRWPTWLYRYKKHTVTVQPQNEYHISLISTFCKFIHLTTVISTQFNPLIQNTQKNKWQHWYFVKCTTTIIPYVIYNHVYTVLKNLKRLLKHPFITHKKLCLLIFRK